MSSIKRSLYLSFLDKYSAMAIVIVTNLALARILTPYDIGIFSIAASLVGLASSLRDFGIGSYLLQEKELTVSRQRSAIGVALVITWTIGGLLAACSGFIAKIYQDPAVQEAILALSINFFFIPLTMVVVMTLRREMRFGQLYRVNLISVLCRSVAGIGLALLGFGFMAMAWSSVAGSIALFLMTRIELPAAGRLLPSLREWRHVVSFGVLSTVGQVLGEVGSAAPDLLIGRILSPAAVGFYSRAWSIRALFSRAILEGLSPVAVSAVAMRHREGGDIRGLMLQGLTHVTAIGWPFFSFVALLTFPVMRILFGDQWDSAVPLARLLCLSAMVGLLDAMTWAVLQGTGSVGKYAVLQAFTVPTRVVILIVALVLGGNLEAVGWASMLATVIHVAASLTFLRRLIGIRLREILSAVTKSAGLALFSSVAPTIVLLFMPVGPGDIWVPALLGACGAGIGFTGAVFLLKHPLADEVATIFRQARTLAWTALERRMM